jgi:hypothetical protein
MNVRKVVAGSVLAAGLGVAGLFGSATAFADVSTNPTISDEHGYGVANHIANFNGDHNGVGWIRSEQTGSEVSALGGHRGPDSVRDSQGSYAPISNAGGKDGNKVVPQTKAGN